MPVLYNTGSLEELGKQIGHTNLRQIVNDLSTTEQVMREAYETTTDNNIIYTSSVNWMYRVARLDLRAKQEGGLLNFWKKMQSNEYVTAIRSLLTVLSNINAKMIDLQEISSLQLCPYAHLSNFLDEFFEGMDWSISFKGGDETILRFKEESQPFFSILSRQNDFPIAKQFVETTCDSVLWVMPHIHEHMQVLEDCTRERTRSDEEKALWVWAALHRRLGSLAPMSVLHVDNVKMILGQVARCHPLFWVF
eukprot:164613-Rhodomonas_salina.2